MMRSGAEAIARRGRIAAGARIVLERSGRKRHAAASC